METNNPQTPPVNPEMPQPLNTGAQTPTEMPMGVPMQPAGGAPAQSQGLPPQLPPDTAKTGGSNKMIMIAMIVIVVILLLAAGGYYYYTTQMTPQADNSSQTPVSSELTTLQSEVETVDVASPDGEFVEIDKSISLLEATPSSGSALQR